MTNSKPSNPSNILLLEQADQYWKEFKHELGINHFGFSDIQTKLKLNKFMSVIQELQIDHEEATQRERKQMREL